MEHTPDAARTVAADVASDLEQHRVELTRHCRRMLGSAFDADDAVQETLSRAWRGFERFEHRGPLRAWLYRIATNVCLDMMRARKRRACPVDLSDSPAAEPEFSVAIRPAGCYDAPLVGSDPAELVASHETVRLAFVAALQHLPPRQRAVLLLHDVLRWKADEVAELLGWTAASVNSALQRARAQLPTSDIVSTRSSGHMDATRRALLDRYLDAFERYDVASLVDVVQDDARRARHVTRHARDCLSAAAVA